MLRFEAKAVVSYIKCLILARDDCAFPDQTFHYSQAKIENSGLFVLEHLELLFGQDFEVEVEQGRERRDAVPEVVRSYMC